MPLLSDSLRNLASALTIVAILIAGLLLGREILIPLTIAVMFAFVLTPVVGALAKSGIPRALALFGTVAGTTVALGIFAAVASNEILNLTLDLGRYRTNVIEKVRTVTSAGKGDSALAKASEAVVSLGSAIEDEIGAEAKKESAEKSDAPHGALPAAQSSATRNKPVAEPSTVVVKPHDAEGKLSFMGFLPAFGQPLAQAALTFLFTIFLMLQYRDIRDRVIRVVGTDHISDTTSAMSEAGTRLSQLFLTQALLNGAFGVFVGVSLWALGIPSAALWGAIAAIMRFVPFVGSVIAAVPPILLAAAVEPGWSLVGATAAIFLVGEPVMGHVIEPHVLGKKAGISPFAMVASASFWTLIWGPVGLVLAAPLTMTLVVLGRYINGLKFFSVLLGDEPALRPEQEFYHRLLSADPISAAESFESELAEHSLGAVADKLVLPALRLAAFDHRTGRLDKDQLAYIKATMAELRAITPENEIATKSPAAAGATRRVFVIAARGAIDAEAAHFMASLLKRQHACAVFETADSSGLTALASARAVMGEHDPDAILIVSVGGIDSHQLNFIAKRALREFPVLELIVLHFRQGAFDALLAGRESDIGGIVLHSATDTLQRLGCERSQTAPASPAAVAASVPAPPLSPMVSAPKAQDAA